MARECANGHVVTEDYLKACPRCGFHLPEATARAKAPPLGPTVEAPVTVPRTLPFVAGGIVLCLFGGLLTYAAGRGPAEVFGWVLIGAGVVTAAVGVLDAVRRRRAAG